MGKSTDGASTASTARKLATLERKLDAALRELRDIKEVINADVRTADRMISPKEASEFLGVGRSKVYAMIREGLLPSRRDGNGRIKVSYNQVQQFIHS